MQIKHIEQGKKMSIFVEHDGQATGDEYEAAFRYLESDTNFVVKCQKLYDAYDSLGYDKDLRISFYSGPYIYIFHGRILEKQRLSGMLMLEQRTELKKISNRVYERDELQIQIRIDGLPVAMINDTEKYRMRSKPDLTDMTFDVSSGGVCVITNSILESQHDPYYLLEFTLSDKDVFLLPAKLVRRSKNPRVRIGRYEYGFQIVFDKVPDEKGRLTNAILSKKLSRSNH